MEIKLKEFLDKNDSPTLYWILIVFYLFLLTMFIIIIIILFINLNFTKDNIGILFRTSIVLIVLFMPFIDFKQSNFRI